MLKNGVEAFRKARLKEKLQFNSGKVDEGQSIRNIADGNELVHREDSSADGRVDTFGGHPRHVVRKRKE